MNKSILILLSSFLVLSGCTSKQERAFMMGCVAHESMKDQCECVYDELEDHYSDEDFERMNRGDVPADFLVQMDSAAKSCQ